MLLLAPVTQAADQLATGATITGTMRDPNGNLGKGRMTFRPRSTPFVNRDAAVVGTFEFTLVLTNGYFATNMLAGLWDVYWNADRFQIAVPTNVGVTLDISQIRTNLSGLTNTIPVTGVLLADLVAATNGVGGMVTNVVNQMGLSTTNWVLTQLTDWIVTTNDINSDFYDWINSKGDVFNGQSSATLGGVLLSNNAIVGALGGSNLVNGSVPTNKLDATAYAWIDSKGGDTTVAGGTGIVVEEAPPNTFTVIASNMPISYLDTNGATLGYIPKFTLGGIVWAEDDGSSSGTTETVIGGTAIAVTESPTHTFSVAAPNVVTQYHTAPLIFSNIGNIFNLTSSTNLAINSLSKTGAVTRGYITYNGSIIVWSLDPLTNGETRALIFSNAQSIFNLTSSTNLPINSLSKTGAVSGYVLGFDGSTVKWVAQTGAALPDNVITNGYTNDLYFASRLFWLSNNAGVFIYTNGSLYIGRDVAFSDAVSSSSFGEGNRVYSDYSVITGYRNLIDAPGNSSFVVGSQNKNTGLYSFVAGESSTNTGQGSVVLGEKASNSGARAFIFNGRGTAINNSQGGRAEFWVPGGLWIYDGKINNTAGIAALPADGETVHNVTNVFAGETTFTNAGSQTVGFADTNGNVNATIDGATGTATFKTNTTENTFVGTLFATNLIMKGFRLEGDTGWIDFYQDSSSGYELVITNSAGDYMKWGGGDLAVNGKIVGDGSDLTGITAGGASLTSSNYFRNTNVFSSLTKFEGDVSIADMVIGNMYTSNLVAGAAYMGSTNAAFYGSDSTGKMVAKTNIDEMTLGTAIVGTLIAPLASSNIVYYPAQFASATNAFKLSNGYAFLQPTTDVDVTNFVGSGLSGTNTWGVLTVHNTNGSAITLRVTAAGNKMGSATTNALVIAAGKQGTLSALAYGTTRTNYMTVVEQ